MEVLQLNVKKQMKRYIQLLLLFSFLIIHKKGFNQELPIYSQYMFNEYLINAAYSGTYYFSPVIINHRNQWVGFGDSAPQTSSFSLHSAVGQKSALGTAMIYDKTNPITRTQLQMSYGYHVIIGNKKNFTLSMALSGTWNMLQFTYQENSTYSEMTNGIIDNVNQSNETSSIGDLNFGIILLNDYFDIGLSVRNLFAPEPINTNNLNTIERTKYILIHGSFLGGGNDSSPIGIIPSFVIRKMGILTYNSLFEVDLNIKLIYRNRIWTGISYRTHEKTISGLIGINTPKAFFGYSYDIGANTNLGSYHNGSHNIAVGIKVFGKKKRSIRLQTPLYLNIDSEWKKLRITDMRNKSTI